MYSHGLGYHIERQFKIISYLPLYAQFCWVFVYHIAVENKLHNTSSIMFNNVATCQNKDVPTSFTRPPIKQKYDCMHLQQLIALYCNLSCKSCTTIYFSLMLSRFERLFELQQIYCGLRGFQGKNFRKEMKSTHDIFYRF